jgi:heme ABC exporter ATP-binding subunit CcmA
MDAAVHLRGTVCLLGRFPALAGIDLDVDRGEIVLLRGANGAGKTTLLRALAGLAPIVGGEAIVLGHDLRSDRRSVRREVGLLSHSSPLYDDLTVTENVRFWARSAGKPVVAADEALDRLGVALRLRGEQAGRLSAGQRRRVALAVVVARRPELWLLDEPHAGLDATARDLLDQLIHEAAASGATVLLASHELERSTALAGREVVLAGGRVMSTSAEVATSAIGREQEVVLR